MGTHDQSKMENLQYTVDQLTRENEKLKADIVELNERLIERTQGFLGRIRKDNLTTVKLAAKQTAL